MSAAILILDDNEVFAGTLARSLTRRGFTATVALNGDDALAAARSTAFDYATIDLQLAQDSGLQWISPLRQALPRARLLVLTGYASIATTVQAIKAGADNYLAKPANVDSILSALQHGTRPKRAPQSPARQWPAAPVIPNRCQSNVWSGNTSSACWPNMTVMYRRRRARSTCTAVPCNANWASGRWRASSPPILVLCRPSAVCFNDDVRQGP